MATDLKVNKNWLAQQVIQVKQFGTNAGYLAVLIQQSDGSWEIPASMFPVKVIGTPSIELKGDVISRFVDMGFVEFAGDGVRISPAAIAQVVKTAAAVTRTNTTTSGCGGSSQKKTSTTTFIFEDSTAHRAQIAFVAAIGRRVRGAMLKQVEHLDHEEAQLIVHEVGARVMSSTVKGDAVSYTRAIVRRAMEGLFVPAAGLPLADELDEQLERQRESGDQGRLRVVK